MLPLLLVALAFQRRRLSRAFDTGVSTFRTLREFRPIPAELRHTPEVRWGVAGVAWGTTIPRLALSLVVGPWYARRWLQIPLHDFAMQAWVRPLAALIPFALANALVDVIWPASNLLVFFAQVAALLPLAALGAWVIGLERHERALISTAIKRVLGSVPPPAPAEDSVA